MNTLCVRVGVCVGALSIDLVSERSLMKDILSQNLDFRWDNKMPCGLAMEFLVFNPNSNLIVPLMVGS